MTGEPLTMSVKEAAHILGISPWLYYEEVKKKNLPGITIGRRIVVPRHALEALIGQPIGSNSNNGTA